MTNVDKLIQLAKEYKKRYNEYDNSMDDTKAWEKLSFAEDELLDYISNEFMEDEDEE